MLPDRAVIMVRETFPFPVPCDGIIYPVRDKQIRPKHRQQACGAFYFGQIQIPSASKAHALAHCPRSGRKICRARCSRYGKAQAVALFHPEQVIHLVEVLSPEHVNTGKTLIALLVKAIPKLSDMLRITVLYAIMPRAQYPVLTAGIVNGFDKRVPVFVIYESPEYEPAFLALGNVKKYAGKDIFHRPAHPPSKTLRKVF